MNSEGELYLILDLQRSFEFATNTKVSLNLESLKNICSFQLVLKINYYWSSNLGPDKYVWTTKQIFLGVFSESR